MPWAPRMCSRKIGPIAPVMGSPSLKATSIGVGLADNVAQARRFASVAGSSGLVGTKPGIARGPANKLSSGNGAS